MIKLEKKELQVLDEAINILSKVYRTSTEDERKKLDIYLTQLGIDGVIIHQSNMSEK